MKCALRCFELFSGLKINYHKRSLLRVNVSEGFLILAADFLNCKVAKAPFQYLGLPIGANPKKFSTWQLMLDSLVRRMGLWKNNFYHWEGEWCY